MDTKNEWIAMKDEKPPVDEAVLVTDGRVINIGMLRARPDGTFHWDWQWDFADEAVTHWMRLPELPQEA